MEMLRRVMLVGVMVLVLRGSVTQLILGTIIVLAYLLLQMQSSPYKDAADNYLASACSFSTIARMCDGEEKMRVTSDTEDGLRWWIGKAAGGGAI